MSDDAAANTEQSTEQSDETLGHRLRTAREARELTVEKIADELRIEEHVLRALEEDRFTDINVAPVFIKGYIKQYGRLLELDYEELREAYRRQADADDVHLRPNKAIHLRDERQIAIWVVAALATLLVAVALLVWWLGSEDGSILGSFGASERSESVSVAAPITSRVQPATQPVADAVADDSPGESSSTDTAAPVAAAQPDTARPAEVDEEEAAQSAADVAASEAEASQVVEAAAVVVAANDTPAVPVEPEPGSVPMQFEFAEESWFELTDARGRRLHYDLAQSGSRHSFIALPPATVLIGNASAVSITVAAQAYPVPASSRRGNVANFVIDPAQD